MKGRYNPYKEWTAQDHISHATELEYKAQWYENKGNLIPVSTLRGNAKLHRNLAEKKKHTNH